MAGRLGGDIDAPVLGAKVTEKARDGNHRDVVLALAEGRTLLGKGADHHVRALLHLDGLAQGILGRKQLLDDVLADDDHRPAELDVLGLEIAAEIDGVLVGVDEVFVGAGKSDVRGGLEAVVDRLRGVVVEHLQAHHVRRVFHELLVTHRLGERDVAAHLDLPAVRAAGKAGGVFAELKEIRAQEAEAGFDRAAQGGDRRHHPDDRKHPDRPLGLAAAGCLLQYARETQLSSLPHINSIQIDRHDESIILDGATRRNLELLTNLSGGHDHTLLSVLDRTATSMGSRLLRRWISRPLRIHSTLEDRQQAITKLIATRRFENIHKLLRGIGGMERIVARIALKSARPRDLAHLRDALAILPALQKELADLHTPMLHQLQKQINEYPFVHELLKKAIIENPPVFIRDGGVIADGYNQELDELRGLGENAGKYLIELENRERKQTGLSTLKVGFNRVHGYYIEISRNQSSQAPPDYTRRQTMKNTERFITPELKGFEDKILSSRERALALEKSLYDILLDTLLRDLTALQDCAAGIAELDVLITLAERAESLQLTKPELVNTPGLFITGGKHIVVEQVLKQPFVPNDCHFDDSQRMMIVTGPNMGGKSTYMRQTAIIVLLAHIGSYVPAKRAIVGPIDRIFTRIGAADDLASGRSTFMVEMTETANILHNATSQSLVLVDEIGRGTSTFDGLSLAWAVAAYLAQEVRAFTLFATHYFELTSLADNFASIINVHLDAVEHGETIAFLHKVQAGPANKSYGLQVAKLAGIPSIVLEKARAKLRLLENPAYHEPILVQDELQSDLFTATVAPKETHPALIQLQQIDPNKLTPIQALETIFNLKNIMTDNDI